MYYDIFLMKIYEPILYDLLLLCYLSVIVILIFSNLGLFYIEIKQPNNYNSILLSIVVFCY